MKKTLLLIILLTLSILTLKRVGVLGQDSEESKVSLSPSVQALTISKGEEDGFDVTLTNNTDSELGVTTRVLNCKVNLDSNKGIIVTDDSGLESARWFSIEPSNVTVSAGASKKFRVTITIPTDAKVQSYYSVASFLFTKSNASQAGTTLNLSSEIATTVYLTVANEDKSISDFNLDILKFASSRKIYFSPDIKLSTEITNGGDIHFRPRGFISIFNANSVRQKESPGLNEELSYILPGQKWSEEFVWKDSDDKLFPSIGKYKAILTLITAENPDLHVTSEVTFYVIPYQYFILTFLLVSAIGGFLLCNRKIRRRKVNARKSQ